MRCTLLLLAVFLLCACFTVGQVNFTPTWGQGKRSSGSSAPASVQATDECKSMDTLIYIYKLVQVTIFYDQLGLQFTARYTIVKRRGGGIRIGFR